MIDRACISLNHRCNLRCKYCHFLGKDDNLSADTYELSPNDAENIIYNIINYCKIHGIENFKLGIVGAGEPLLSFDTLKRILEIVEKSGEGRLKLYTVTNGVSLTEDMIDKLYGYKDIIEINFSLDGYEEVHN
ncbi:MAG: radical SAM protein, partial [Clostridia bacterium]|nr:radical SAM protein [Clostridia bacterium]